MRSHVLNNYPIYLTVLYGLTTVLQTMDKLCSSKRIVDIIEPILAEDSTFSVLSLSLSAILEQLDKNAIHHDYLVALLLVLLAESGFRLSSAVSDNSGRGQNTRLVRIPIDWKSIETGVYEIRLVLHNLEDIQSKLIAIPYGDKLILNMFPCIEEKKTYSIIVQTLKYVNPYSFSLRYMNLREISHRFKDQLVIPVRSDILSASDLTGPSFQGLPIELQLEIIAMLSPSQVKHLALCSKKLYQLCMEQLSKRKSRKALKKVKIN